jgi:hypothetical protein
MKAKFLTSAVLPVFIFILALGSCRQNTGNNEDTSNPSGNNNPSEEAKGNHANEPRAEPGTHYPGSGGKDSARNQVIDTLHKVK